MGAHVIDAGQIDGLDATYDAARANAVYPIQKLLAAGIPIDGLSSHSYPALHATVEHHLPAAFAYLLERGASVRTYGNDWGWTPLCHAVELAVLCCTDDVRDLVQPYLDLVLALATAGADPQIASPPLRCSPLEDTDGLRHSTATHEIGDRLGDELNPPA